MGMNQGAGMNRDAGMDNMVHVGVKASGSKAQSRHGVRHSGGR